MNDSKIEIGLDFGFGGTKLWLEVESSELLVN